MKKKKKNGARKKFIKGEKCVIKIVFTEGGGMPKIDVFLGGSLKNKRLMTKGRGGQNPEKLMTP